MKKAGYLLLNLLMATGCYSFDWKQVPSGMKQYPLDLQVAGLTQRYTVVEPQPSMTAGSPSKHPAVVLLHSGFSGDEGVSGALARRLAAKGVVVILPAYRGELRHLDGKRSDGKVEFCHGEVDDAQAALTWLRAQPQVDTQRLAAVGSSHGGCIALRLVEREPELRAIVTFSAPVAAEPLVQHLRSRPDGMFFFNGILAGQLAGYIKASPKEHPEIYEDRSPLSGIERVNSALMIIHGTADEIVPVTQACWMYQVLAMSGRTISERRIDTAGRLFPATTSQCPKAVSQLGTAQIPAHTEFVFLEGQGHLYSAKARHAGQDAAMGFLEQELHF